MFVSSATNFVEQSNHLVIFIRALRELGHERSGKKKMFTLMSYDLVKAVPPKAKEALEQLPDIESIITAT